MSADASSSRVEVASLDEALAAVRAARAAGRPLCLESPAAAAGWHGIGWWRELLDRIAEEPGGAAVEAVLDCGSAPGLALAALRAGCGAVRVAGDPAALAALAAIAAGQGSRVLPPWSARDQFAGAAGAAGVAGTAGAVAAAGAESPFG